MRRSAIKTTQCSIEPLIRISLLVFLFLVADDLQAQEREGAATDNLSSITLNEKASGYRGIWYMNQPSGDQYVYKYSGGLGTYCAKHRPFAVYAKEVNRTFFCYGGTSESSDRELQHFVSFFDHETGLVPRPTLLLDKKTNDAHDNPVLSIDKDGYLWLFSTSHGRARPSFIHRSKRPFEIDEFIRVDAVRGEQQLPFDNFSYFQAWYQPELGFLCFLTRYNDPVARTAMFIRSRDGIHWDDWQRIAAIEQGHYQVSGMGHDRIGSMFNFHPEGKGLNWRTNLYYVESKDFGETWEAADGTKLKLPLTSADNFALVRDYEAEGKNVYLKDLQYDAQGRPILLYLTSSGYEAGPKNGPRDWTIAKWHGDHWTYHIVTQSDNNYDMGELWLVSDDDWRIVGPTGKGPQPFNPGGEVSMWQSRDQGESWVELKRLTHSSKQNHTYVRRPVNTHPDFFAFWADGHGRQPSSSSLYFSDQDGNVFTLPREMTSDWQQPQRILNQ